MISVLLTLLRKMKALTPHLPRKISKSPKMVRINPALRTQRCTPAHATVKKIYKSCELPGRANRVCAETLWDALS